MQCNKPATKNQKLVEVFFILTIFNNKSAKKEL